MTGPEWVLVAGSLLGKLIEGLVRAALFVALAVIVVIVFLAAFVFGATKLGRQVEYRTRPQ